MSTDSTNGEDTAERFRVAAIKRRLPSGLTDLQERTLVCAVRNPDATVESIAEKAGVTDGGARSALRSFARDTLGSATFEGSIADLRGRRRNAKTFDELTPKQKAVVDFCARHDVRPGGTMASSEMAEAIGSMDRYAERGEFDEHMSDSMPGEVMRKYGALVIDRRRELARLDDLPPDVDPDEVLDESGLRDATVRDLLERGGLDLPDENLDGLGETDESVLDELYAETAEVQDAAPDPPAEFEDHREDEAFTDRDVEVGQGYVGVVNNVDMGAVWVTVAGDPRSHEDVSGPVWHEYLPPDRTLADYGFGDVVRVVCIGRSKKGGKVRHRFRMADERDEPEPEPDVVAEDLEARGAGAWRASVEDRLNAHDDALDSVEDDLQSFEDSTRNALRNLSDAIDQLAERVPDAEQAERLEAAADLVDTVEVHGERLDRLDEWVDEWADDIGEVTDLADYVNEYRALFGDEGVPKLDELDDEVEDLRDRLDGVESAVDEVGDRVVSAELDEDPEDVDLAGHLRALREAGFEVTVNLET